MKIFLDTNVFYNDWFMNNANFKYLFHFLNNEEHELILSKLVIQETENIRSRKLKESLSEVKRGVRAAQKLSSSKLEFEVHELGVSDYELTDLIKRKVDSFHVFDYGNIEHSEVVERALVNKKPFIEGEKGYRDTLIWLSFLQYISANTVEEEEIVFITENKSDFFMIKGEEVSFHRDLQLDIGEYDIKSKISPFTSLFSFVSSTIDKDEHAIDKVNMDWIFEEYAESEGDRYLKNMSNADLCENFESSIFESRVKEILDIRTDIWEGMEDSTIEQTTNLKDSEIYVSYSFNLRRVTLEIDIPEVDYIENREELNKLFYEVEIASGVATLSKLVRPYFDVSFIYNDRKDTLGDFEVSDVWLRM
jgi:predicted nucleic acid-binding protein